MKNRSIINKQLKENYNNKSMWFYTDSLDNLYHYIKTNFLILTFLFMMSVIPFY